LSKTALRKDEVDKSFSTENIKTSELSIGGFSLTDYQPDKKSIGTKGSSRGSDWLYLYRGNRVAGGLNTSKLMVTNSSDFNGDVNMNGNVYMKKGLEVKDDIVFNGDNKWIMHTPDDGRKTMYMAPKKSGNWDWSKQFAFDNDGYMSAYGGGINIKGGSSIHNPNNLPTQFPSPTDDKNYIRGDTELAGNLNIHGAVQMAKGNPGAMIERNYGKDSDRYGIGQYDNGTMRMYTAGWYAPATLNLSIARDKNTFDDVIKIKTDKSVTVDGPAKFNKHIETPEIKFSPLDKDPYSIKKVSSGNNTALRVTINDRAEESFEIWGDSCRQGNCQGQGKKLASVTANGLLCLGNLCMKEQEGKLQVCNKDGADCKKVNLS
jgi:hypothetical protein